VRTVVIKALIADTGRWRDGTTARRTTGMSEDTERVRDDAHRTTSEAYFAIDETWRHTRTNDAGRRLLDSSADDPSGERIWDTFAALVGTPFEDALRTAMEDREPVSVEAHLPQRDAWYELRAYPDGDGLSSYVRDVTERRERRKQLEAYRARFEALTGNTNQVVLTIDDDSVVQYVNDAVEDLFGYAPDELVGESLLTIIPERFHDAYEAALADYLESGEKNLEWEWIELPGRHRAGHEIPLGISFGETTVEGDHRFTALIRDVTDRKRKEREREATIDFFQDLYDVTTDQELSFEKKIDRTLELTGERLDLPYGFFTRIETDGDDDRRTVVQSTGEHPLLQAGESCLLSEAYCRRTLETDGLLAIQDAVADDWTGDIAYERFELGTYVGGKVKVDDELYGTLCFAASNPQERPFSDTDRMVVRVVSRWVSYELERHRRTAELQRMNERLEDFASVVSHDLRNPLTVANGYLELARTERDTEDLAAVDEALDRMETLIEDLLTLAQEGDAATAPKRVDLKDLCADCWETTETADATLAVETTAAVWADPGRLKQLLENLYRNAVEHGGDDVTITVGDLEDGFYVEDDGPGIPADEREQVFESGFTRSETGTGFGLSIVEEIATAHGWDVATTEGTDGGARFEITNVARP